MQVSDRIGRPIKLQDLHVLMAVVQAGSMNKAAALLNTGQSAISRSIAELEHTVGVRLLDRNGLSGRGHQYLLQFLQRGQRPIEHVKLLFDRGADLRRANLTATDFAYANLIDCDLRGANVGDADFTRAKRSAPTEDSFAAVG